MINYSPSSSPKSTKNKRNIASPRKEPKKGETAELDKLLEEMEGLRKHISNKKTEQVKGQRSKVEKKASTSDIDGYLSTVASKNQ